MICGWLVDIGCLRTEFDACHVLKNEYHPMMYIDGQKLCFVCDQSSDTRISVGFRCSSRISSHTPGNESGYDTRYETGGFYWQVDNRSQINTITVVVLFPKHRNYFHLPSSPILFRTRHCHYHQHYRSASHAKHNKKTNATFPAIIRGPRKFPAATTAM